LRGRAKGIHVVMHAFRVVLVLLLFVGAIPWSAAAESATQLYIGHRARLTAEIPADWTIPAEPGVDYRGGDGGFVFSYGVPGDDLDLACADIAEHIFDLGAMISDTEWRGDRACHIEGSVAGAASRGLVVHHAHPFPIGDEISAFAAVITDLDHFTAITDSISFDPDRVTPQLYLDSVLDLIEARAWYAGDVDWARFRTNAEPLVQNADTLEETHWVIKDALANMGYWGDNHSFFLDDVSTLSVGENNGLGMIMNGKVVALVYPDGPAAEAGIQVGDTVVSVDGNDYSGRRPIQGGLDGPVMLTIRRHGLASEVTIGVKREAYSLFLSPNGRRLAGEIGYIELFGNYQSSGSERTYVTEANAVLERVDRSGTCGWIVDLRRNMGGNYMPMVVGVTPLLGEGPILSWISPNGDRRIVALREGRVFDNGQDVSGALVQGSVHELSRPTPPVAVLIGPQTASSGEATTLAFVGRPDTRLFGEITGGYTTANSGYLLFDGSIVLLAQAAMADRHGNTAIGGIEPDEIVRTDWTIYGTADDPVIQAATEWLERQPGCAQATPVATTPEAG